MIQIDRLRAEACRAMEEYDAETMAGGEPAFPKWAHDVLSACDRVEACLPPDMLQNIRSKNRDKRLSVV